MDKLKEAGTLLITAGSALTVAACGHLATELDSIREAAEAGDWDKLGIIVVGHLVFAVIGLAIVVAGMLYRLEEKRIGVWFGPNAAKVVANTPIDESPSPKIPIPTGYPDHVLQWVDPDAAGKGSATAPIGGPRAKVEADADPKAKAADETPTFDSQTALTALPADGGGALPPLRVPGIVQTEVRSFEAAPDAQPEDKPLDAQSDGTIGISDVYGLEDRLDKVERWRDWFDNLAIKGRLQDLESAAHTSHTLPVATTPYGDITHTPVHAEPLKGDAKPVDTGDGPDEPPGSGQPLQNDDLQIAISGVRGLEDRLRGLEVAAHSSHEATVLAKPRL